MTTDPLEQHLRDAERKAVEMLALLRQAKTEAKRMNSSTEWRISAFLDILEETGIDQDAHRTLLQRLDGLIRTRMGEQRA